MSDYFIGRPDSREGDFSQFDVRRLTDVLDATISDAKGSSWYDAPGSAVDVTVARLCMLRRAKSGESASMSAGDEAVRSVLDRADPETVVWLLTRTISYMDEQGFPDFVPGARFED
ncbi:MAG TPA: hypothetical protein VE444_06185 [Gaiellaceae bacterium]|nr:hypothetical protein [Gaiellaceae bacterium]